MAPGESILGQCPWTWDSYIFRSAPSFPKCSRVKCFGGVWGFLLGIGFGALPLGIAFSDLPLLGILSTCWPALLVELELAVSSCRLTPDASRCFPDGSRFVLNDLNSQSHGLFKESEGERDV